MRTTIDFEYDADGNVISIEGFIIDDDYKSSRVCVNRARYRDWEWAVASSTTLPSDLREAQILADLQSAVIRIARQQAPWPTT